MSAWTYRSHPGTKDRGRWDRLVTRGRGQHPTEHPASLHSILPVPDLTPLKTQEAQQSTTATRLRGQFRRVVSNIRKWLLNITSEIFIRLLHFGGCARGDRSGSCAFNVK